MFTSLIVVKVCCIFFRFDQMDGIGYYTTSNRWMFDGLHAIGGGVHEIWRQRNYEARERRQKKRTWQNAKRLEIIPFGTLQIHLGLCKFTQIQN